MLYYYLLSTIVKVLNNIPIVAPVQFRILLSRCSLSCGTEIEWLFKMIRLKLAVNTRVLFFSSFLRFKNSKYFCFFIIQESDWRIYICRTIPRETLLFKMTPKFFKDWKPWNFRFLYCHFPLRFFSRVYFFIFYF